MHNKPRLFVGSSSESIEIARAIRSVLGQDFECTVWETSFKMSITNIESLFENVYTNDFAVFVFSADDVVEKKGHRFFSTRDNVLYELGLFSGRLGRERCFFVLPESIKIELPSDLAGVAHGSYEADRSDRNVRESVSPFCSLVREHARLLGLSSPVLSNEVLELKTQFECADWLEDVNKRVSRKNEIIRSMIAEIKRRPLSKLSLTREDTPGFFVLLAASIQANPQYADDKYILSIPADKVPRGVAQKTIVDSIELLNRTHKLESRQRILDWFSRLKNVDPSLESQLIRLRGELS